MTTVLLAAAILAAPAAYPPLPEAVSSLGAAALDGYAYVYGGHAGKTHSYSTETTSGKFRRLNLADPAKGWEELAGGPSLQGLALVAHGGKIYRVGGMRPRNMPGEKSDNHSIAVVAAYDPKAGAWEKLPDLPAPRSSHDAAVVGNTLFVAGGWAMTGAAAPTWHDTALTLDLANPAAKWETMPQPFQRRALTMAALGGKLFVIAGLNKDAGTEPVVNIYDPAAKTWATAPEIPGEKMNSFTPAACVVNDALYLSPADGVVYKLAGDKWEPAGKVPTPRYVHRLVPAGGSSMLALGGASKKGNVAAVETIAVSAGSR